MTDPLVETIGLEKYFPVETGFLDRLLTTERSWVKAVDGVDLEITRGETFGLVGESGCGKSTLGQTILQLLEPTGGKVWFKGQRIDTMGDDELRDLRKDMQIIFQDPAGSLNPRRKVRRIIRRPLDLHDIGDSKAERRERVSELIEQVGLSEDHLDRYPHEFSGGQQQRIAIARALAVDPDFIVADEPVSALDVNVQAQILNLIEEIQTEYDLTILFIAHDLSVVRHISDRVGVMYLGDLMEVGTVDEIFDRYQHPYTDSLMQAIPTTDLHDEGRQLLLEGDVPSPIDPPSGCKFRQRCPIAEPECTEEFEDRQFSDTQRVHCIKRSPERHGGTKTTIVRDREATVGNVSGANKEA